jgi:hypothetical protein
MPLHYVISHPKRLVIVLAKGKCSRLEVESYFADVTAQGGAPYGKIFDVTKGEFTLSVEDIDILARRITDVLKRAENAGVKTGPLALVADTEESRALAGLFARTARIDRPVAIFSEHHDARKWLEECAAKEAA